MPQQGWGCLQRFLSERHFRQNAWTLLALAAALIAADSLQFLACFLPSSPPACLALYSRPSGAALRVLALPLAPALLAPGSLSLLAATRSPSLSGCASRACCLALPAAALLLAVAVGKVADHAAIRLQAEAASDSAGAAAALANLAGLTLCVAADCLLLVFLTMQACVARRWQRRRRRRRQLRGVAPERQIDHCLDDVDEAEEEDYQLPDSEDEGAADDLGARLARSPATAL